MTKFGKQISLLREKHKYTQEEVALKLGISRAALSHYETGRREPDYETLRKFSDLFHVSMDYLMGRQDDDELHNEYVKIFEKNLELSDDRILEKFTLQVDGRDLTREEAKRLLAFIRAERAVK